MNRNAMRGLADFIEARTDIDFRYQDLDKCVYGFASRHIGAFYKTDTDRRVMNHLGINPNQATEMFSQPVTRRRQPIPYEQVSRANAVEMLRRAAETGEIYFNEPTYEEKKVGEPECNCAVCYSRRAYQAHGYRPITREDLRAEREAMEAEARFVDQHLRPDRRAFTSFDDYEGPTTVEVRGPIELAGEPSPKMEEPQTA